TIKRHEHEDKVEALRQRMRTPEGEALYKKRAQTIEPRFADLKEHRGLRCFASFGKALAEIQVGLLVLVHNVLWLMKAGMQPMPPAERQAPPQDTVWSPAASPASATALSTPATATPAPARPPESGRPLPRPPT